MTKISDRSEKSDATAETVGDDAKTENIMTAQDAVQTENDRQQEAVKQEVAQEEFNYIKENEARYAASSVTADALAAHLNPVPEEPKIESEASKENSGLPVKFLFWLIPLGIVLAGAGYYLTNKSEEKIETVKENVTKPDKAEIVPPPVVPEISENAEPPAVTLTPLPGTPALGDLAEPKIEFTPVPSAPEERALQTDPITPSDPQAVIAEPNMSPPVVPPVPGAELPNIGEAVTPNQPVPQVPALIEPPKAPVFVSAISPVKYREIVSSIRDLREKTHTGEAFTAELTKVKLAFAEDIRLPVLDRLSAVGAPTQAELTEGGLNAVRNAAVVLSSQTATGNGALDRLQGFLQKNIVITPMVAVGEKQDDLLALIVTDIKAGDFASATKRINALPENAKKPFAAWARSAEEKSVILAEIEMLEDMIYRRMFPEGSIIQE